MNGYRYQDEWEVTWLLPVWKKRRRRKGVARIAEGRTEYMKGRKVENRKEERFGRSRGGQEETGIRRNGVKSNES